MADVIKKSEEAWNVYRMDSDFMSPKYTFMVGYVAGWDACKKNLLRVIREMVPPTLANEIAEMIERTTKEQENHAEAGNSMG